MASRWAEGLPHVTVPMGEMAKSVTVVVPYYENPAFLSRQLGHWTALAKQDADIRSAVSVIVVDDGSPTDPARSVVRGWDTGVSLRLFRIEHDVRWNWLAARNIGAHHATADWLLLTDMDHVVPAPTARAILFGQHDPAVVYAFSRREHTGQSVAPHSASFLMTKALFWTIGGYDETLSGYYGTDGDFRRRVAKVAPIHVLPDELVRYEFVADSSTTRYKRKQAQDAIVQRLIAARPENWQPKTLSFKYEEVAL